MPGRSDFRTLLLSCTVLWCFATLTFASSVWGQSPYPDSFTLFESGHVRPLALSLDGQHLYAVNTPDNRLEIFEVRDGKGLPGPLRHVGSVQVGLEPVAVAVFSKQEVWVVNHLSDSVSIVDVQPPKQARVRRTLLVGDEPRDIVFAGTGGTRAFITTAHRGQNSPIDPQLTTPGIGRADVWVFNASEPSEPPLSIVTLFADTPRALAVSPDGATVYAAAFHSGNRTTSLESGYVTDGGPSAPDGFGLPAPTTNFQGIPQPDTGLIVKYDGEHWRDHPTGRVWDHLVKFDLPDLDVFAIDANADPPVQVAGATGAFAGVGTVLFNMVVHPTSGKIYVSNTEALNEIRFEGPGTFGGTTVRGHTHESRITVIDGSAVSCPTRTSLTRATRSVVLASSTTAASTQFFDFSRSFRSRTYSCPKVSPSDPRAILYAVTSRHFFLPSTATWPRSSVSRPRSPRTTPRRWVLASTCCCRGPAPSRPAPPSSPMPPSASWW